MRILIATVYPDYGGSTKVLKASFAVLRAEHGDQVLLRSPFEGATAGHPLAMPIESLSTIGRKLAILPRVAVLLASEAWHVSRLRPDVVYVHDSPSLVIYGLIARLLRAKVVYHVHGEEGGSPGRRLKDWLVDAKIHIASFLQDHQGGRQFLIANPIEAHRLRVRDRRAKKRLFLAGSVSDRKNQKLAVEMLAELCGRGIDCSLHLCGPVLDSKYAASLREAIARLCLESRVVFEGVLKPCEIYDRADVIVSPSKFEAQPLVFLEAMSAGVPVVASQIPAHAELVRNLGLDAGMILADLDPKAFADAVEATDPDYFWRQKERVAASFSTDLFNARLIAAFHELEREWQLPRD